MGVITRLEDGIANLLERPFRGGGCVDAPRIEIEIRRAMERKKYGLLEAVYVPHLLEVFLDRRSFKELEQIFPLLGWSLTSSIQTWIDDCGYQTVADLQFTFRRGPEGEGRPSVRVSAVAVEGTDSELSRSKAEVERETVMTASIADEIVEVQCEQGSGPRLIAGNGDNFSLKVGDNIIGRHQGCDIVLADVTVSEMHASVRLDVGIAIFQDLGSSNRSTVNQKRVEKAVLREGDRILLGTIELIFHA